MNEFKLPVKTCYCELTYVTTEPCFDLNRLLQIHVGRVVNYVDNQ